MPSSTRPRFSMLLSGQNVGVVARTTSITGTAHIVAAAFAFWAVIRGLTFGAEEMTARALVVWVSLAAVGIGQSLGGLMLRDERRVGGVLAVASGVMRMGLFGADWLTFAAVVATVVLLPKLPAGATVASRPHR